MKTKEFLVIAVLALGIIGIFALFASSGGKSPQQREVQEVSSDASNHHKPPPPPDDSKFEALLDTPAPEFSLKSYDGQDVSLSSFKGKNVVLFFSEGAMCYPSCWDQIVSFEKNAKEFAQEQAVVLTVVVDSKQEWQKAVLQMPALAKATVLLDIGGRVSTEYGMLTLASSMHRGQFPGHTYVVVDKDGIIRALLDDEQMGINDDKLLAELAKI